MSDDTLIAPDDTLPLDAPDTDAPDTAAESSATNPPVDDTPDTQDDTPTDAPDTDATDPADSADPAIPVAEAAPEKPEKPTPYRVKLLGQEYAADDIGLKGAVVEPDGSIRIPADAAARHAQLLGKARYYEEVVPQQIHQLRQQAKAATEAFNADAERGKQFYTFMKALATGKAGRPDQTPEQNVYDFVLDLQQNLPLLEARVDAALAKQEAESFRAGRTADAPQQDEAGHVAAIVQEAQDKAESLTLEVAKRTPGLTRDHALTIASALWTRQRDLYVYRAPQDYPEAGIVRGQPMFNGQRFAADVADRAALELKANGTAKPAKPAGAANSAVVAAVKAKPAGGTAPPPPGRPAAGVPSGSDEAKVSSYEDYERMAQGVRTGRRALK